MQAFKSGYPLAKWLFRVSLLIFILLLFINSFKTFNLSSKEFYISLFFIISGIVLFIGGFISKPSSTIVSGFLITILSVYTIIVISSGTLNLTIANYLIILAIGFYFVCSGNQYFF